MNLVNATFAAEVIYFLCYLHSDLMSGFLHQLCETFQPRDLHNSWFALLSKDGCNH